MPTAPSSTERPAPGHASARSPIPSARATGWRPAAGPSAPFWHPAEIRRAFQDTGHLVRFWSGTIRSRKAVRIGVGLVIALTAGAVFGPLFAAGAGTSDAAADMRSVLPSVFLGFLSLAVAAGVATGGGRELLPSEHGTAFATSATTDHFGALLLAPLSLAWMVQAWALLGVSGYAHGPDAFPALLVTAVLWIVASTVVAQAVAWTVEVIRRGQGGPWAVRGLGLAVAAAAGLLYLDGRLWTFVDALSPHPVVDAATEGSFLGLAATLLGLLLVSAVALAAGTWAANVASRRPTRDEVKVETRHHRSRPNPPSVPAVLRRIDRGSVWRAVPMRRGIGVLAVGPGLVAIGGAMTWENVVILPGLVVSGGALLFGVNAWALDGRGGLWRESLPVAPGRVFDARARVMAEWLLLAALVTLVLASLRAGTPTVHEVAAVVSTLVVVTLQVVATSMAWSVKRPFAVNMRSVRATPAPPAVMVGYSAKLALSTTLTAMVFSSASWVVPALDGGVWIVVALAVPFVLWSTLRLLRARRRWVEASTRAGIVTMVAA